jgi:hypothetical protein
MNDFADKKQGIIFDLGAHSGGPFVRDIREHLLKLQGREIQYLEIKQMTDILARYRARVRVMVRHYRGWQAGYMREADEIEKIYAAYEGIFIRRQLQDSWKLYVAVNRDYHEMRRVYLASLRQPPHRRAAS